MSKLHGELLASQKVWAAWAAGRVVPKLGSSDGRSEHPSQGVQNCLRGGVADVSMSVTPPFVWLTDELISRTPSP